MINLLNYYKSRKIKTYFKKIIPILEKILTDYNKNNYEVNLVICDNNFIQDLNKNYRSKDYPTDVLSFPQLENDDNTDVFSEEDLILGDIVISYEKALEQSVENNVTIEEELARLSIHGILHLLGYDHERSEEDEKIMMEKEDFYLNSFSCS